jgi:hypothetical protein
MSPRHLSLVVGLSLCASLALRAQVVGPSVAIAGPDQDNVGPVLYNETAIGVSASDPSRLIAAIVRRNPDNVVEYSISTDYGQTWTALQNFVPTPLAPCFDVSLSSDPGVATDAAGNLFVSATAFDGESGSNGTEGIFLGRMPVGTSSLTSYIAATPCVGSGSPWVDGDRSRVLFGPGTTTSPAEWGLVGYYNADSTEQIFQPVAFGTASIPTGGALVGTTWGAPFQIALVPGSPPNFTEFSRAVHPAIVRRGNTVGNAVAVRPVPTTSLHTENFASVAYFSNDKGASWQRGNPGNPSALTQLDQYWSTTAAAARGIDRFVPSGVGVSGSFSSDLAADPAHDDTVYALVSGHAADDPNSGNTDLFVFRSQDGGRSFPLADRLRLTDDLIGLSNAPAGSQQFDAAICVDIYGGVNILYYQDSPTDAANLRAWYIRLTNYSASNPTQMGRFVAPLSPAFHIPDGGITSNFIGDYQGIATSQCYVYPCFMSTQTHHYVMYVARILLPECLGTDTIADFNADGAINLSDAVAFVGAFTAGSPSADVNHDLVVNAADFAAYMNAYSAATSP